MSTLRPLPSRPNLEYEHKQAKALLRELRAGNADALERARTQHPQLDVNARIKLADAQLIIAREYGFASWPKLVRYFGEVARQQHGWRGLAHEPDFYLGSVRSLLARQRRADPTAARSLAAYLPRLYGRPVEEVMTATIDEDEARLVVARMSGCPSWAVLMERSAEDTERTKTHWEADAWEQARTAIAAADLAELQRVVAAHPELLAVRDSGGGRRPTLMGVALAFEKQKGAPAMHPIMQWLDAQGFDRQGALNEQLCRPRRGAADVQELLERGADPDWIAPSGFSILEHALIHYWNPAAVDVLAARARPRRALWIAAGLGDVDGVSRFLDRHGRPTKATREHRPDFNALGLPVTAQHPEPDDEEILLEAFVVAMINRRIAVLDYMIARGFPINSLMYGAPVVTIAVGNGMADVVATLVCGGADLDLKASASDSSARELAREFLTNAPEDVNRRRIAELCGLDADTIVAEVSAKPVGPARWHPHLDHVLELASDDAVRLGQTEIRPENLLFGILRNREGGLSAYTRLSRMDRDRFRADFDQRMYEADDRLQQPRLPMHPDAQAIIDDMMTAAAERRRSMVIELNLLHAVLRDERSGAAALLANYDGDAAEVMAQLERSL